MRRVMGFILLIIFLVFTFQPLYAGWLDRWFDQQVSSGPNYFEGQKRGYFTAGSFSARIPTSVDYLFSVETPRIKAGCGGIDAFMGGFGFVNFDYLVQKLQRLIQAAPVIAFQIALNTLSAQLESIVGKTEDLINALNSIQLNECALMKPFTTITIKEGISEKQFVDAAQAALQTTGLTDLYKALFAKKDKVENKSGQSPPPAEQYAGCSQELKNLVTLGKNSLINYLVTLAYGGNNANILDNDIIPIIRAMVGDVVIVESGSVPFADIKPSCPENIFQAMKEGKLYKKNSPDGACVPESQRSLVFKVYDTLNRAYLKSKEKQSGAETDANYGSLVRVSPLPAHLLVRYAVATGDTSILTTSADPIAKGMLYQAYTDIYNNLLKMLDKMQDIAQKTSGDGDKICNVDISLMYSADELRKRLFDGFQAISEIYSKSLGEMQKSLELASLYKNFETVVFSKVAEKLGKTVAERAIR